MLRAISESEGVWDAEAPLKLPGGAVIPMRMTVLRLPDGGILLHSPVAMDDALAAAVQALGPVRHVVAPSLYHHLHARAACERWPDAKLWGAPGLAAKRPRLRFDAELHDGAPTDWGGAVEALRLGGAARLNEVVFLHRPSGTLLCSDLVFNMRRWQGNVTGFVLFLMGTQGRLAGSRALHFVVQDRAAFFATLKVLHGWPFRRILMGHGEPYESPSAPDELLQALALRLGPRVRDAVR